MIKTFKEKLSYIILAGAGILLAAPLVYAALFPFGVGGTNSGSFITGYPIVSNGTSLVASSSPTFVTFTATSTSGTSLIAGNLTVLGTCTGCDAITLNSGTANRVAYYSGTTAISSFNGLITGSDGTGSTTIASNLTVTSIFASSTVRITGALTLDTALTVPNGGTGIITCTDGGVMLGSGTGAVTCTSVLADGEILVGDGTTDPVAESGATLRTSIGVGTGDSPTFTGLTLTTLTVNGASTLSTSTIQGYFNTGIIVATSSITTNNFTVNGTLSLPADSVTDAMVADVFLLNNGDIGTGVYDFGGATSFEIVNGASPTVDATGELALDTTTNNLVVYDGTASKVFASATTTLYNFNLASSSVEWFSGGIVQLTPHFLAQQANGVICGVDAGTSVVINLSDGTNDTNTVTCTATAAQHAFTTNNTWTANEAIRLEVGAVTGAVDYVYMRFIGFRTSD